MSAPNILRAVKNKVTNLRLRTVGCGALKLVNFACACHLFQQYVGRIATMSGVSMLPTLAESGEVVVEDCFSIRRSNCRNINRGDLVVFTSPIDPYRIVCKRVLGLPGDVVCVDPTGRLAPSTEHVIIPRGHLWVIGDNAEFARDSRTYGPISISLVRSKLFAKIWPLKDFTIFRAQSTRLQ